MLHFPLQSAIMLFIERDLQGGGKPSLIHELMLRLFEHHTMMPVGTQRRSRKALNQKRASHVFFSLFFPPVRVVIVFLFCFFNFLFFALKSLNSPAATV